MYRFEDFEEALNKTVKHPKHHRQRREQFQAEYFESARERLGMRTTFGQRSTPPPIQTQPTLD